MQLHQRILKDLHEVLLSLLRAWGGEGKGKRSDNFIRSYSAGPVVGFSAESAIPCRPPLIFAIFNRARRGIMIDSTIYSRPGAAFPVHHRFHLVRTARHHGCTSDETTRVTTIYIYTRIFSRTILVRDSR